MDLSQEYAERPEGLGGLGGGAPGLHLSQLSMTTLDGEGQTGGNTREADSEKARGVDSV